jgi:hypothetical protein
MRIFLPRKNASNLHGGVHNQEKEATNESRFLSALTEWLSL